MILPVSIVASSIQCRVLQSFSSPASMALKVAITPRYSGSLPECRLSTPLVGIESAAASKYSRNGLRSPRSGSVAASVPNPSVLLGWFRLAIGARNGFRP